MTEQEWLASKNPARMIQWASRGRGEQTPGKDISDRKLRLFACAEFRYRALQSDNREQLQLADLVDLWADGGPAIPREKWPETSYSVLLPDAAEAATRQCYDYGNTFYHLRQVAILRDIVGNPFRPVTLPMVYPGVRTMSSPGVMRTKVIGPASCPWITPTVLSLAQAAYEERAGKVCERCEGCGKTQRVVNIRTPPAWVDCSDCHGTGRTGDGTLDPFRLGLVADALEEAGCLGETELPCPRCSPYKDDRCPQCNGSGSITYFKGPGTTNPNWRTCNTCSGTRTFPPGFHPERDPASGRHEGGWTNCKTCNGGGRREVRPGTVLTLHPLLAHLRSPETHYRGMWSLDIILGKE